MTLLIYKDACLYADKVIWDESDNTIYSNDYIKFVVGSDIIACFAGDISFKSFLEEFDLFCINREVSFDSVRELHNGFLTCCKENDILSDPTYTSTQGFLWYKPFPDKLFNFGFSEAEKKRKNANLSFHQVEQNYDALGSASNIALVLLDYGMDIPKIFELISKRDPKVGDNIDKVNLRLVAEKTN